MEQSSVRYSQPSRENGPPTTTCALDAAQRGGTFYHGVRDYSFADELAHNATKIPSSILLDLIGPPRIVPLNIKKKMRTRIHRYPLDTARLRRDGRDCGEKSGWGKSPWEKGAAWASPRTAVSSPIVATVVELSRPARTGAYSKCVDSARCGARSSAPDNVRNQL